MKYSSLNGSGRFRNTAWDPVLLISQIVSMQCLYYASLGLWIAFSCFLTGTSRSLDHIFDFEEIGIRNSQGVMIIFSFMFNAFTAACIMWLIVQRSRLCLDFSGTLHSIHLLSCWYYSGHFPNYLSWWTVNIICLAITCISGELLCMRSELKEIPLSMGQKIDL